LDTLHSQIVHPSIMSGREARFEYKRDLDARETQKQASTARTIREHTCALDVDAVPHLVRGTGIICTIGPSCQKVEQIQELIYNGLNIARLNFSHGSYEYHQQTIDNVKEAAKVEHPHPVAIALDTKGPEIRTGMVKSGGEATYKKGQDLKVTCDAAFSGEVSDELLYLDYVDLTTSVTKGSKIFIADGSMSLIVKEIVDPKTLIGIVQNNVSIGSRKNCNLPGAVVSLPAVSEKDKKDLEFGVKNEVDMVFASFIRKRKDVQDVRAVLGEPGKNIKIIAKIENHEGVKNIDDIIQEADGIMVARGDLGMEIPLEKVFIAQKMIIGRCNAAGKPVICATQMLESMTNSPRPTRAEASDVANAVMDGADCVMLSGETAKGEFPTEAVSMMHKICREAESAFFHQHVFDEMKNVKQYTVVDETATIAAVSASFKVNASAIIVLTTSGRTAYLLSHYRPRCPIIVITRTGQVGRQSHLYRGMFPLVYDKPRLETWNDDVDARLEFGVHTGLEMGFIKPNSFIVFVSGYKPGARTTNTVRILQVKDDMIIGKKNDAGIRFDQK